MQETDELQQTLMAPADDHTVANDFLGNGGTSLKATKRKCFDCSGCLKGEVRKCPFTSCPLYPFRFGRNPNRTLSGAPREAAVARLKRQRCEDAPSRRQG